MNSSTLALVASQAVMTKEPKSTIWPGLLLTLVIATLAQILGNYFPLIGGPVIGIVLGIVYRNAMGLPTVCAAGVAFSIKRVLQWSIIALGFGLSFKQVVQTGGESLAVTFITITVAFITAFVLGRLLGIPSQLKLLIGVGTAICGGSAIAAVTPIIKPDEHETSLAISTIFLFNVLAVLTFPAIGHFLQLSDYGFGMWAGTAINDTSSVVAAAYSYSQQAGDFATIVKLTRATLIIPICLFLAFYQAWYLHKRGTEQLNLAKIFPWFILWFLVASGLRSLNLIPLEFLPYLDMAAKFMIVIALTAIGLASNISKMLATGVKPILLGFVAWIAVATSSLLVQYSMGQL